ncbi:MAG: toprim domain-containing protein [Zoogloea sp.]|nr:toprim domain-containing protein [Zoogloea sp.]
MAWRIAEEEIERVKRATDLVALVRSRGIELKKHGSKDWVGRCPFHPDQATPNLIVSPDKGLFHCMSCGKAGNAIQFVQYHDGVSFRHAHELLRAGGQAVFTPAGQSSGPLKTATIPRLPCPLDVEADDATLLGQVAAYYHQKLKESPAARAYLASRGLDQDELIDRYQLGFADRTLGLRLPDKNRQEGERLRTRLTQLGVWRESGHEHFNGCIVVPFHECEARAAQATHGPPAGNVVSFYGRRVTPGTIKHLYPPGPHRGLFNRRCLPADEVILCEAVFDALTFCAHGFPHAMALFGTEGFTDELWEALKTVKRVRIAYDADEAGERAAQRDAERFRAHGIEVFRVKFPHGMDANEYACKVQPADKALALLINGAAWCGQSKGGAARGGPGASPPPPPGEPGPAEAGLAGPRKHVAMVVDDLTGKPLPIVDYESLTTGVGWAPEPFLPAPYEEVEAASLSLAASVSSSEEEAAKKETAATAPAPVSPVVASALEPRGEAWFLDVEGREYRVAGLEKTVGTDSLKVTLRVRVAGRPGAEHGLFHLDQVDLNRDVERRRFIERAAEETGLTADLLKRDLGRLLLSVEQAQVDLLKPQEENAPLVTLSPEEREEALAWLKAPNLIGRLREAFRQSGIIGEETNTLVAYLACVSRKLERPLAIIIQSASAAGKTTLMDAVLSFFPEEERIKYSAMTGQSLYYLGETNLKHKILAVVEEAGAEKASYALKLLQSEGELTIASTGKDPQTGKMVTQEYHVEGPAMIFLTTTAVDLDEELQNRCLTLAVDETPEQTERIHRVQRERRTLAGLIARQERKDLLRRLHNAQRLLAPVEIINPYAPALTFVKERTRHRRDHEKYLTLIDAIALLHQHQREKQLLPAGQVGAGSACCIEVTLEDIALANELAPEILARSLDELPPQTRALLGFIRQLLLQKRADGGARNSAAFSRKELRDLCGWSLTQVIVHLERLVALEYVALRHGRLGSQFIYEALFDLDAPEALAHIGLIDVAKLGHAYDRQVSGLARGVSGQTAPVTGGDKTGPIPSAPLPGSALGTSYRGNGIAHLDGAALAPVVT